MKTLEACIGEAIDRAGTDSTLLALLVEAQIRSEELRKAYREIIVEKVTGEGVIRKLEGEKKALEEKVPKEKPVSKAENLRSCANCGKIYDFTQQKHMVVTGTRTVGAGTMNVIAGCKVESVGEEL